MEYLVEFLLLGVGLAMDAFAVSICKGLAMRKVNKKQAVVIALFFGGFQAIMPIVGWFLCKGFQNYIEAFDHWIAFALLAFIGMKMIIETLSEKEEDVVVEKMDPPLDMKEMLMLAIATSIDALAVGISLAALDRPIVESSAIIGVVTFVISIIGVYIGNFFGNRYKKRAEFAGGIILVLIGVKILCEHMGWIAF
ncbi:manganese efflux pump MntP family protein [Eubacterium sp. LFL-14]|uniref:Putative manganese efflux pump MntP n=1 Tax=Eubacterium album TaxID=2978477 RepID=A0ABT2LY23_9FIRM|nr:manganese efflux pump MntP family protein [Eubacterium sp. LFL-14]MCT7398186.1 manganese efflux pump MntP family protein [Eubacterium sp. LFL-14]